MGRRPGVELDVVAPACDPLRADGFGHDAVVPANPVADHYSLCWCFPPMTVLGIGISYGVATLFAMFSGMPIAFALGAVAVVFMAIYMPHASLDPAVHPQGRGDRKIPRRSGPLSGAACLAASHSRRAWRRQRICLRAVRSD